MGGPFVPLTPVFSDTQACALQVVKPSTHHMFILLCFHVCLSGTLLMTMVAVEQQRARCKGQHTVTSSLLMHTMVPGSHGSVAFHPTTRLAMSIIAQQPKSGVSDTQQLVPTQLSWKSKQHITVKQIHTPA